MMSARSDHPVVFTRRALVIGNNSKFENRMIGYKAFGILALARK
jgi:hypothetical protein